MKIKSLNIENFRTYKNFNISLEEEANIVLIYGNNGYGKTSIFDSIEWGITGKIKRFENNNTEIKESPFLKNCFSPEDSIAKVKINFTNDFKIEREVVSNLNEDYSNNILVGNLSEHKIENKLFQNNSLENQNLNKKFNFSYVLSQDLITDFMKRTKEQDRYEQLSEMFGLYKEREYQTSFKNKEKELKLKIDELNEKKDELDLKILKLFIQEEKDFFKEDKIKNLNFQLKKELKSVPTSEDIDIFIEKIEKENIKLSSRYSSLNEISLSLKNKEIYDEQLLEIENLKEEIIQLEKKIMTIKTFNDIKKMDKYLEEKRVLEKNLNGFDILKKTLDIKKIEETLIKYYRVTADNDEILNLINKNKELFQEDLLKKEEIKEKILGYENQIIFLNETISNSDNIYFSFKNYSEKVLELENINECPLCGSEIDSISKTIKELEKKVILKSSENITKLNKSLKDLTEKNLKEYDKLKDIKQQLKNKAKIYIESLENKKKILEEEVSKYNLKIKLEKDYDEIAKAYLLNSKFEYENLKKQNKNMIEKLEIKVDNYEYYIKTSKEFENKILLKTTKDLEKYIYYKKTIKLSEFNQDMTDCSYKLDKNQKIEEHLKKYKEYLNYHSEKTKAKYLEEEKKKILFNIKEYSLLMKEFRKAGKDIKSIIEKNIFDYTKNYNEVIKKLYNYLNPHKKFGDLELLIKNQARNRSKLGLRMGDEYKYNPIYLLSSAQSNTLALSIFLGVNLISKTLKLETILLDDPIQNMDDINIHSFVDLLKQVSQQQNKQIIMSTHDERIAKYMINKLGDDIYPIKLKSYGEIE